MRPTDWENSTFDEVLLVIKGKSDDRRFYRNLAMMVLKGMTGSVNALEDCPIPYDDEVYKVSDEEKQQALEDYKEMSEYLNSFDWSKN